MEQIRQSTIEAREELRFNFEEIEQLLPAFVTLVKKIKNKIEDDHYDLLLSDEVGGRIPTLVFRGIIKELRPESKVKTLFIGAGKAYVPGPDRKEKYDLLLDTIKKRVGDANKILVITQFIYNGKSTDGLVRAIHDCGINDVDVAALDAAHDKSSYALLDHNLGKNELYIGGSNHHSINERHEHLSGVRKSKEYNPTVFSQKDDGLIKKEGRLISLDKWADFFVDPGDKPWDMIAKSKDPERIKKFDEYKFSTMTDVEKREIQDNVNKARQDIKYLVAEIIREVWPTKGD